MCGAAPQASLSTRLALSTPSGDDNGARTHDCAVRKGKPRRHCGESTLFVANLETQRIVHAPTAEADSSGYAYA